MLGIEFRIEDTSALETKARELAVADALTTSEGTLYPMLSRLRRGGWVVTTWRESPAGPPRRYYTLTREGRSALAHFRAEWAAFRDAVLFKAIYAWGLRRREAAMLDITDWGPNAKAPQFWRFGVVSVRYGKASRGSPPRHRTVLTTMGWAADAVAEWVTEIRPVYEADDCGTEFTPELREQEERSRAHIEDRTERKHA